MEWLCKRGAVDSVAECMKGGVNAFVKCNDSRLDDDFDIFSRFKGVSSDFLCDSLCWVDEG